MARKWFGLALLAVLLTGCDWLGYAIQRATADTPTYEWTQRYTLVLDTPQGERRFSSNMRIAYMDRTEKPQFGSGHVHAFDKKGEAVVSDLGEGRYLFALTPRQTYDAFRVYADDYDIAQNAYAQLAPFIVRHRGPPQALDPEAYPLLVTFGDVADPASVERVDPDDLAATFGPGYALKSITLEITDEPVTEGRVEEVLMWLNSHLGKIKPTNKKYASDVLPEERLYRGDFLRR